MSKELNFDTLGDLYAGGLRAEIDKAIQQVLTDCDERPGLAAKRQVVITLNVKPITGLSGPDLDGLAVSASVVPKVPKIQGGDEAMHVSIVQDQHGQRQIQAAFAQPTLTHIAEPRIIPEGSN